MARAADDIVLLEDAWTDFLCIEDEDPAKDAIGELLGGASFGQALELWLTTEEAAGRQLREDYKDGFERAADGDGWLRIVVGSWAIVFRPLTADERELTGVKTEPSDHNLLGAVVSGIRGRPRFRR